MGFKQCLVDAVCYWERKRVIYNVVLAILVLVCWGPEILSDAPRQWLGAAMVLLVFAIIANILFSLAYPVDLVIQVSPLRAVWARTRWLLFVTGLILASALALWVMLGTGMA